MKWDPLKFERSFQEWFQGVIERESQSKSFRKGEWCKRIGLDEKRFRSIKAPGNKLSVRLEDIIRIAEGLNMSPAEIIKEVSDQYRNRNSETKQHGSNPHTPVIVKKNAM